MTEAEWLTSTDPAAMLDAVGGTLSPRKLRLFAGRVAAATMMSNPSALERYSAASGRDINWYRPAWSVAEAVAEDLERFADRDVSAKRMRRLAGRAPDFLGPITGEAADVVRAVAGSVLDRRPLGIGLRTWLTARPTPVPLPEAAAHLRDLVGDPFRPPAPDARWRTGDVLGLARAIYEDRAFDRLPILADALMDAGCADKAVLGHCQGGGPHSRGCWVVDLLLGRA